MKKSVSSVFCIVFTIILIVVFSWILFADTNNLIDKKFTFRSFLEYISEVPQIATNFRISGGFFIGGNWGIFDTLRLFLNSILDVFNSIATFGSWILQLLATAFYFVKILFV